MRILLIAIVLLSFGLMANPLIVGLIDQDRPPYFFASEDDESIEGIYIDILEEIGDKTGIEFEYKFLPQKRVRASLKYGAIDVEPGIDPIWRKEEGEEEASVYTDTIFISEEVLVYNTKRFPLEPDPDELVKLSNCMVLGFNGLHYGTSPENPDQIITESQILDLIRVGRCDWALFPLDVFNSNKKHRDLGYTRPVAIYHLSIRLHVSQKDHLPSINRVISELKESGRLEEIFNEYVSEEHHHEHDDD